MLWNFRIIKRKVGGTELYSVHRIFYERGLDSPPRIIENIPASIIGNAKRPMLEDVELMVEAFEMPVIYIPEWNKE